MRNHQKMISLLLLMCVSVASVFAAGSSVGIDETNVRDKFLTAGVEGQLLMSFTVEPWEAIPGDLKFTTIDLHCTAANGFSRLMLQSNQELATTEFTLEADGIMRAHFDEIDFIIPRGQATEFSLFVDVNEGTGDFITACVLDNLEFLNLESGVQYESGRYVFDFDLNTLVYVNDPATKDRDQTAINVLNQVAYENALELDSQENKLLEFSLNASEEMKLENLFIYCSNASELKNISLRVDGAPIEPKDVQVDWLTVSRPEWSSDKRIIFADLNLDIHSNPRSFELYADTHDYFSNLMGPSCALMDMDVVVGDTPIVPTEEITKTYSDISESDKYFEPITYLTQMKVFEGYPDGTFKSLKSLSRAELIKTMVIAQGISPTLEQGYEFCFPDVAQQWFAPYVCYAKEQNWVQGYPDDHFYPSRDATKVEAIKMLVNSQDYSMVPVYESDSLFTDVDHDKWYAPFIKAAKERGLLEEAGIYGVGEKITRGQISENLYRVMIIAAEGRDYYSDPKRGSLHYDYPELGLDFDYPYDWEVMVGNGENLVLISPKRYNINYRLQVTIPGESFEAYESSHEQEIEGNYISVKEIEMILGDQTYFVKEYAQHGGLTYLLKVGGVYVKISTDAYLDESQKEEIGLILDSLSFSAF